jgi:cell wall-associated NlpC family hydrolase
MLFSEDAYTILPTQASTTWEGGLVRRLILVIFAGCFALGLISSTTFSANAETSPQLQGDGFISQGSVVDSDSPELAAVRADIAEEESLPDYSQVVDNENVGRFSAPRWEKRSDVQGVSPGQLSYGGNFVSSDSGGSPARFTVGIPTSHDYTVYAWWPAYRGSNEATRFGIDTASGTRWTAVDQSTDGGIWIKLGTYAMQKGERVIQVSAGSSETGASVADAVAVVRGNVTMPPPAGGGATTASTGETTFSLSSVSDPNGRDVVRVSKRWLGVGYRWGTCTRTLMSCTCETKKTYRRFGHDLSMDEGRQWRYDRGVKRRVWNKSNLHLGDHVFFKENGRGFTHVAIYSGNGNVVHASSYYGKVVESKIRYLRGFHGAKRYRLH